MERHIRPQLTRPGKPNLKHRELALFESRRQLEAFRQQRLDHEEHLILRRVADRRARLDAVAVVGRPFGQAG
jgi:hypothetical protein